MLRVGVAALLALGVTGIVAPPGQAHSQLVSSSPANGATLAVAPTKVVFTFDEDLLPDLDTLSINNDQGVNIASKQVEPVANTLSIDWPANTQGGTYQVAYRIVSGDGHPVTGAISFSVGATNSAAPTPASSSTTPESQSGSAGVPTTTIVSVVALIAAVLSIGLIVMLVRRGNAKS